MQDASDPSDSWILLGRKGVVIIAHGDLYRKTKRVLAVLVWGLVLANIAFIVAGVPELLYGSHGSGVTEGPIGLAVLCGWIPAALSVAIAILQGHKYGFLHAVNWLALAGVIFIAWVIVSFAAFMAAVG